MNFILEETKRKEIIEQIDKSIFVEAGAGAGKTTIIINRIMNQIRQGIKPQHIVVITFTNAASSELYDRIEKRLEEEERISQNAQEQRYFQNALENLNQMTISTIHSFCYKLLMERAFEAKMPIGFTILENEQTLERQQKFIEQWIGTLKKEQILEMQQAIKMVFENSNYKRWVKTAFETICEKPEHIHIVSMEDVKLQEMKQKLDTVCQNVEILKQSLEQELLNFIEAVIKFINGSKSQEHFYSNIEELFDKTILYADYINLFKKVKQGISEKELKEIQKLYEKYDKKELKIYKKDKNVNVKALEWLQEKTDDGTGKHLYIKWRDCIEFLKEYGQKYAYFAIMKYALQARDAYKDSLNGISVSNDELLQRAKDFICNSSEARAYFANKYHYIYVDEFQDTDHVQAELIWKLVCDKTNKLRQGALFVVGDPKQSIYRFRGGEPEVYYEIKERMEKQEDTCIYQLNENYRSNEKIISWVNETFAPVISTEKLTYEDMECAISDKEDIFVEKEEVPQDIRLLEGVYEYRFSVPETENTENIEQVKQSEKKNKQTKEELVQEEAKEVAKMIYRLVNGDYGVYETKQVEDGTLKRSLRKITYKDFLVLSWKKTDMNIYLKEMHKLGIPVDFSGTILPKEDRIIQSFFHLYRYLITPFDRKVQVAASYLVSGDSKIGEESEERLQYLKQLTKGKNRYGKAQFLIEHIEYLI
ncbi:MAG: UvrD-helicase domain-containing protein, partial [Lachnospiraceae bacterium]|nr:UvrD-helicase domain-containing protein [Lachnospiraceae bacterium]